MKKMFLGCATILAGLTGLILAWTSIALIVVAIGSAALAIFESCPAWIPAASVLTAAILWLLSDHVEDLFNKGHERYDNHE